MRVSNPFYIVLLSMVEGSIYDFKVSVNLYHFKVTDDESHMQLTFHIYCHQQKEVNWSEVLEMAIR